MDHQLKYHTVHFRFYAELNDFLPQKKRQTTFDYLFSGPLKLQEAILSIGIPLSEIDLILVNEQSADLHYRLKNGDRIAVYPVFEAFDISGLSMLQSSPLRSSRFILDAHLGKLAKYLRILGFDCLYKNDFEDALIIQISLNEQRIILTRDKALLTTPKIQHGYYVRAIHPRQQLKEIILKFDLHSQFKPFTRCSLCNDPIHVVDKRSIQNRVPRETFEYHETFYICEQCDKVYWQGSHYQRMMQLIESIR